MPTANTFPAALAALNLLACAGALAQAPQPPPAPTELELYTSGQRLSAGFGHWSELGLRASRAMGAHRWLGEVATMRRFGENGNYLGLTDTVTLDADWFASLGVGAGDGAAYLPTVRVDGFLHRKLLPARNLVASLGLAYYKAPDNYRDHAFSLGASYYFAQPWVLQGEVRFNRSSPGSVDSRQQFLALSWGRDHATQATLRHAWGTEAYQAVGSGNTLVDFNSEQTSLNLRHWLGTDWGLAGGLEHYRNPGYRRDGLTLALFWNLP